MKTKKTGRGVGRKIEREQGKEEKRKKNVFLIQEHYVQRLWVAGLFLRHIPAFFTTLLCLFLPHIFAQKMCRKNTSFCHERRVAASKSRGLFHFIARGEATAFFIFPSDRQRFSHLTERKGKAERARERSEEKIRKEKGKNYFPFYPPFAL